jgi:hypothetical protein
VNIGGASFDWQRVPEQPPVMQSLLAVHSASVGGVLISGVSSWISQPIKNKETINKKISILFILFFPYLRYY